MVSKQNCKDVYNDILSGDDTSTEDIVNKHKACFSLSPSINPVNSNLCTFVNSERTHYYVN